MSLVEILVIALGLSMDAFAVSVAASAGGYAGRGAAFRLAFHFGLFQALLPLLGWLLGARLTGVAGQMDHWIAFALLAFVGVRMIRSGLHSGETLRKDPSRGMTLVLLALATSLDAFAVGVSLGVLGIAILRPVVIIGLVTGLLSLLGVVLGRRLGILFGRRTEVAGGIMLLLIGGRILWEHLH